MATTIITLLVYLLIIGLVLWLINAYTDIEPGIKTMIRFIGMAVAVFLVIKFLLSLAHINLF